MKVKKTNGCSVLKDKALDLDQFGTSFNFKLPEGKDTLNTMVGSITSVTIVVIVIFYASLQMHRLTRFGENLVTTYVIDSNFSEDFVVSTETKGLKFAFALTAYDNNYDYVDESEYGHVSAMFVQWGIESNAY